MAKRGNHRGFVTARVNANVEGRADIEDSLSLAEEIPSRYDMPLPDTCVRANGCCPCCGGCFCPPLAKFTQDFMAKQGKSLRTQGLRF